MKPLATFEFRGPGRPAAVVLAAPPAAAGPWHQGAPAVRGPQRRSAARYALTALSFLLRSGPGASRVPACPTGVINSWILYL